MAVSKQEVIIEFDADTGEAEKNIQSLEKSTEGVGKAAEESALGFKAVGTAIKATGIGLLVAVLAKLVEKFSENKKVADAFAVTGAALGTVFNQIIELAVSVGEKLFEAFTNPQEALANLKDAIVNNITSRIEGLLKLLPRLGEAISAAFKGDFAEAGQIATDAVAQVALGVEDFTEKVGEAAEAVQEYVVETTAAVASSTALERELQKLRDAERDLSVETAQQAANVEELKRQRDDERLSIDERIKAAEEAAAIDQRIASENVRIQEEKARLLAEEIELQGATEERLQALADAQIAAADARAASAGVQTELMTSVYALNQELIAQEEERLAAEEEARLALEERLAEEQRLKDEAAAKDAERRAKEREEELANAEALQAAKYALAQNALGALAALNEAFAKEGEAQSRRNFKIQKALSLAQTTIGAVEGTQNAFTTAQKSPITALFPGYPFVQAGIAAAFGAAQIATVGKSKYQGGTTPPPPPPSGGGGGGGAAAAASGGTQAPQLDLGFLGAGAGQEAPVQAYVLAENVSTAQQANQKIQDQATL